MTLAALIRKRESGKPANANPANPANDGQGEGEPLAGLAALALANPTEAKTEKHRHWLIRFADREPLEVFFHPDGDLARIAREYPGYLSAEPIPEPPRPVLSPSGLWYFTPAD